MSTHQVGTDAPATSPATDLSVGAPASALERARAAGGEVAFEVAGLGGDAVGYLDAWELQRRVHAEVVAGDRPATVLLLEHPPTFTAGKRTEPHERPADSGGAPVIDVDRGGKITFHGPGQLVAYPIVPLPDHVLVVDFVRRMEEAMIRACADLGVVTGRVPGRSGAWLAAEPGLPERKVGAIGIRVSHGVTMHGIALNCDVDLGWFDRFVPCGIADAGVTSLSRELGRDVPVTELLPVLRARLAEMLAWEPYSPSPDAGPAVDDADHGPRVTLLRPSAG
ncbi:lipoyl(octanoyl) transferase LipB [Nocardioides sp. GY 10127]|uniref:lipoyl(octanoyl) transferase LipB n=1 Tax=Nocardioides sp. GY 10127 TaxID=2569762 RepID=UPI0010A814B1|nr:lipoyl(octanoyl) transferase LipB [Nocardioides sp. GY 10127]TIC85587.1 lipoyl(octanoyl) transferase LipB [Nocardioides sp. GY 10127]